jgi:hypothetical protein
MTIRSRVAMAREIGVSRLKAAVPASASTSIASSVA